MALEPKEGNIFRRVRGDWLDRVHTRLITCDDDSQEILRTTLEHMRGSHRQAVSSNEEPGSLETIVLKVAVGPISSPADNREDNVSNWRIWIHTTGSLTSSGTWPS